MQPKFPPRGLYAITAARYPDTERLLAEAGAALAGGAVMLQFRDKSGDPAWRLAAARALHELCERWGVPLVINDDVELARAVAAAGVHLGGEDADPASARDRLEPGTIIGVSCYDSLQRAERAVAAGADYLAFGSLFDSHTKPAAVRCPLAVLEAARQLGLPLVAIGGLTPENGGRAIAAGASLLAVISGVFDQPDVQAAARRFMRLWRPTGSTGA